jgi:hypothetical protein
LPRRTEFLPTGTAFQQQKTKKQKGGPHCRGEIFQLAFGRKRATVTYSLTAVSLEQPTSGPSPGQYCRLLAESLGRIDPMGDRHVRLNSPNLFDRRRAESVGPHMRDIESLLETCLAAERDLVAVVDPAGGALPLPDGRTVTVGRAEFDAMLANLGNGRG